MRARPSLGQLTLPLLLLLLLFAHRDLIYYEPPSGVGVEGAEGFLFAPTGTSPYLILSLTLFMLIARWRLIIASLGTPSRRVPAGGLVILSAALSGWGYYVNSPDLQIPALMFWILGAGWLLSGSSGLRLVLLPALFLVFAIVPPAVLINAIIFPLQLLTAQVSSAVLDLVGVRSYVAADLIFVSDHVFHVIETCSGLRSIETLVMAAVVYGEMFHLSRLRMTLLIFAAPVVGFVVNQVRVMSIVVSPYSHFAEVHTIQGIFMLIVGVLAIAGIDHLLGRFLTAPRPRSWAGSGGEMAQRRYPVARLVFLVAVLSLVALTTTVLPRWKQQPMPVKALSSLPADLGDWKTQGLKLDRSFLGSVRPDKWVHREYTRGEEAVQVFVVSDRRLDRNKSLLSAKTKLPGPGWRVVGSSWLELEPGQQRVEVMRARFGGNEVLVYHWYEGMASFSGEVLRASLGLDRSPWRRHERALAVRLSTRVANEPGGEQKARARLDEFAHFVRKHLPASASAPPS